MPTMYYVGLVFNIVFIGLSVLAYLYILRKTGKKYSFTIWFAAAWLVSAISYGLLISGASANELRITALRIVSYAFFLTTLVSLITQLSKIRKSA